MAFVSREGRKAAMPFGSSNGANNIIINSGMAAKAIASVILVMVAQRGHESRFMI